MKKLISVMILASLLLTACAEAELLEAPSTAGVGRTTAVSAGVPEESSTEAETEDPAIKGEASYDGSELGGNLTYTTYKGKTISDFSFLDGLSKGFFSDTSDKEYGSWYCGRTVRNLATGEVTVMSERAPDVLDAMEKYNVVYRKNEDEKVIYLTFDCGYENGYTDEILDVLKEKDAPAAFFLNGQFIKTAPDLVKRMLDEGHIVGNHGNNHAVMSSLSLEKFFYEVESNNALLKNNVEGAPYMKYFRPSYGSCSEWDLALYQAMDLECVLYSWAYYDYDPNDQPNPASALEAMKKGLHDGSVLMLHCVGETNGLVLGDFIDYARSEGYTIGAISDK